MTGGDCENFLLGAFKGPPPPTQIINRDILRARVIILEHTA
jgi:hypothetical protein